MKIFSFFFSHFDFFIFCCSGRNGRRNEMKSRHRDFEHIMDTFPDYERGLEESYKVCACVCVWRGGGRGGGVVCVASRGHSCVHACVPLTCVSVCGWVGGWIGWRVLVPRTHTFQKHTRTHELACARAHTGGTKE